MVTRETAFLNFDNPISVSDTRRYFQDKAKKQPKKARTRAIIIDAIIDVIALNGLDGTTIREIVESAGVSLGTFYNHFENRNEAIQTAASSVAHEILTTIVLAAELPDKEDEAIVVVTHAFMATAILRPSWGKTLASTVAIMDATLDPSAAKLEMLLNRGHSSGVFRVTATPLLSLQVRALQTLAMVNANPEAPTDDHSEAVISPTCEAILRILGKTPTEAEAIVKKALR